MSKFEMLNGGKIVPESSFGHIWEIRLQPVHIFRTRSCWLGMLVRRGDRHDKSEACDVYIMQKDNDLWAHFTDRDPEVGDVLSMDGVNASLVVSSIDANVITIEVHPDSMEQQ